jgi:DNA-binding NtrC family response regulator
MTDSSSALSAPEPELSATGSPVLVVDDDRLFGRSSVRLLRELGYPAVSSPGPVEALRYLRSHDALLVLTDLRMPEMTGMDFVRKLREEHPELPVVIVTGFGTIEGAVEAMRLGASDFLTKPLERTQLSRMLEDLVRSSAASSEPGDEGERVLRQIAGSTKQMLQVRSLARAAARTTVPVLIHGPSGTGKEMVARAIHALSDRHAGAFVPVNCGGLPEGLVESELFGSAKGAYTGAATASQGLFRAADGGTIFLDEIGEMPKDGQVKLLRVLQERVVRPVGDVREHAIDVRVLAATNRCPTRRSADGGLRSDLYYRVAVLSIELPALVDHLEDLPELCDCLLAKLCERAVRRPVRCREDTLAVLGEHTWPGNVRELENVLEGILAVHPDLTVIRPGDLPRSLRERSVADRMDSTETLRESEAALIWRTLEQAGGNKAKAARMLGISRPNLHYKLGKLGALSDPNTGRT